MDHLPFVHVTIPPDSMYRGQPSHIVRTTEYTSTEARWKNVPTYLPSLIHRQGTSTGNPQNHIPFQTSPQKNKKNLSTKKGRKSSKWTSNPLRLMGRWYLHAYLLSLIHSLYQRKHGSRLCVNPTDRLCTHIMCHRWKKNREWDGYRTY